MEAQAAVLGFLRERMCHVAADAQAVFNGTGVDLRLAENAPLVASLATNPKVIVEPLTETESTWRYKPIHRVYVKRTLPLLPLPVLLPLLLSCATAPATAALLQTCYDYSYTTPTALLLLTTN